LRRYIEAARFSVFDFFIEISVLVRNAGFFLLIVAFVSVPIVRMTHIVRNTQSRGLATMQPAQIQGPACSRGQR
jgi:hypothetical protein